MKVCKVGNCPRPHKARGLCGMHYLRWKRTGHLLKRIRIKERANHWTGDVISYRGVHRRLERYRGKASEHDCYFCGAPADEWALVHEPLEVRWGTNSLKSGRSVPYSVDLSDYEPLDRSCHRRLDAQWRKPVAS